MKRLMTIVLVAMTAAALGLVATGKGTDTLRIGVAKSLFRYASKAEAKSSTEQFETFMKSRTGLGGEFVTVNDAVELAEQLQAEKVHLGTFHGIEFAWVKQKYPKLTPLVVAVNQDHRLRAHILVATESPIRDFAGLKGKSLAVPRGTREHCRVFLECLCDKQGQAASEFFAEISKPGNLEDALDDAVDGMVQAVLVDNIGLDSYRQRKPARFAKLKEIEKSAVFPAGTVAYHEGSLDEETLDKVKKSLVTANDSADGRQILFAWKLTAFARVPKDYGQIVDDIVKSYPQPESKKE